MRFCRRTDFRLGVGLQHANLFNRDHVGTFNYVTSPGVEPGNQVNLYGGCHRGPSAWHTVAIGQSPGGSLTFMLPYRTMFLGG